MKTKMTMVLAVLAFVLGFGPVLAQQSEFAPAIYVNARVISQYEFKQRVLFMTLLRQPGDITKAATSTLIDDSLRREAAKALDVTVSDDDVKAGMTEFA